MSRLSLEIPGPRYYTAVVPHDPPSISQSFDSRGGSPSFHNSAPHESPYSSLNDALRPPAPPAYQPPDFPGTPPSADPLPQTHLRHRRDLPTSSYHPPSRPGPDRLMNSRRGRSHSPYPHMGHIPDSSSSQRPRHTPVAGSYLHPQQQDPLPSSHYAGGHPGSHIYAQQSYHPEAMSYPPSQPHYQPADSDRFPHTRNRQREPENVPTLVSRGNRNPITTSRINYRELMDCYNGIMTVAAQDHPAGSNMRDLGDLMRNHAVSGLRMFESASENPSPTTDSRSGEGGFHRHANPPGATSGPSSPPQGRRGRDVRGEGQVCKGCDATSTPEWRRGPLGPRTLCNACGLVYAKMLKRRSREVNAAKSGANKPQDVDSADEGMSEPETTESPVSDPHDRR